MEERSVNSNRVGSVAFMSVIMGILFVLPPAIVFAQTTREVIKTKIGEVSFIRDFTDFKFTAIMEGGHVFSKRGKADLHNAEPTSGFLIKGLDRMEADSVVGYVMGLVYGFSSGNPDKSFDTQVDTIMAVNFCKAFCSRFSVFDKKGRKTSTMIVGLVPKDGKGVLFVSSDYNGGIYQERFFKTFSTIRF